MKLIDTHAHLNDERFDAEVEAVIDRARAAGVVRILVIGIDINTSRRAVELARTYDPLDAVVGIQPNSLGNVGVDDWQQIVDLADDPAVVALGETGLDNYWDFAPIEIQRDYFARHLELGRECELPVVIHCREAEADVIQSLDEFQQQTQQPIRGVMHSYCGDAKSAKRCLDFGLHISFAGMVTFKKNNELRDVAATVPINRLLVETDSPYLSPHPLRGRQNEPAHVVHTAKCLAEVKGVTPEELAAQTTANAVELFGLAKLPQP